MNPATPATNPRTVGFLAELHRFGNEPAALVLNAAASPAVIAEWCWGEIAALLAVADLAAAAREGLSVEDVGRLFVHRLQPLEGVARRLADMLTEHADRPDLLHPRTRRPASEAGAPSDRPLESRDA